MKNLFGLLVTLLLVATVQGRKKSPLLEEDSVRIKNKAAECVFGKQVMELHSQWIPDLGAPTGVLYCTKCECIPIQKKRRQIGKVQCRDIKNECPEPKCDEPELLPGRCCKTCPGDTNNPDVIQDILPLNALEEEEKSSKHYAALLTGRSSLVMKNEDDKLPSDQNKNNVVATGRFTLFKKSLYYTFTISDKAARPRSLQFVNVEGMILEEFTLSGTGGYVNSVYQNATRKVCGAWKRLPREYRRLLKDERMFVVLVWGVKDQAEFTLSGQVMKYVALRTELFSSLLEPAPGTNSMMMAGAGGTAIVSTSTAVSPVINVAVIFNGIFMPDEVNDVPIDITLSFDEKKEIIFQKRIRVQKPAYELNLLEVTTTVAPSDLRLLARGRLVVSVSSASKPEALKLSGSVMTKATCEIFQTTLSSATSDRNSNLRGASGLSWLYLNNEGSLVYNVQVDGLNEEKKPVFITLVDVSTKRKRELEDLTPSYYQGWANGTLTKLGHKVIESLYSGNLMVNVATEYEGSLIHGKLTPKFVADSREAPAPVLLKREDYSLPSSAVGLAWISIDNDCHIHYDISLSGLGNTDRVLELYMELLPMIAPGAPVLVRFLDEFQGKQVEGSPVESLPKEELKRLDTGVVFLKIKDKITKNTLLGATLKEVVVPQTCLSSYEGGNDVALVADNEVQQTGACFHEGKFYQEEAQWISSGDPCTMCFCQNGIHKCDTMTCPDIVCPNNEKVKFPDQCCAVCSNSSVQESNTSIPKGCNFASQFYSAGSKFHPFLIPNGFDPCTECYCDPLLLEVKCMRQGNEKMCSRQALAAKNSYNYTYLNDPTPLVNEITVKPPPPPTKSPESILASGGCRNPMDPNKPYANGAQYHPYIESVGEHKCVTCSCRNGKQHCEWDRCTLSRCRESYDLRTMSAKHTDYCCSEKHCRKFRQKERNRNHNG